MVGCLRRLRMFEVEGRGTKKGNCFTTIFNNNYQEIRSGRMEKALINNQASARTESYLRLTEVKGMANKGSLRGQFRANKEIRQQSLSTMIKVRYIFAHYNLTFFGFRSARLLSRRRRLLGSRLALESKKEVAV